MYYYRILREIFHSVTTREHLRDTITTSDTRQQLHDNREIRHVRETFFKNFSELDPLIIITTTIIIIITI